MPLRIATALLLNYEYSPFFILIWLIDKSTPLKLATTRNTFPAFVIILPHPSFITEKRRGKFNWAEIDIRQQKQQFLRVPVVRVWMILFGQLSLLVYEQDRQCTYNVTLRRVLATIVAVEKQRVLHNLNVRTGSLSYPACNANAPYCLSSVACPALQNFCTFSHRRNNFWGKKRYWT